MTYQEFKRNLSDEGKAPCEADFELINYVYNNYPAFDPLDGRNQAAYLYETFGMRLFRDMKDTADRCVEIKAELKDLHKQIEELNSELDWLKRGEIYDPV